MNKSIFIAAFFFTLLVNKSGMSQVVVDNFTDGDFTSNPVWQGSSSLFTINALSQLQSADLITGQAYLTTSFASLSLDNKEWDIWVKQSFAGSDNNQSRIYLASQSNALAYTLATTAGTQGYFLKLGEAGSADAIKLCRDDGLGNVVELASGTSSLISASFTIRLKVTRDATGLWTVLADPTGGTAYQSQLAVTDNTYNTASSLGIICNYTSSNADNFFFDDIYFGDIIVDAAPPAIVSVTVTSSNSLDVLFSENLNAVSAENILNYSVNGLGNPTSAALSGGTTVTLTFATPFPENIQKTLLVDGVTDESDNAISNASINFIYVVSAGASFRDIVFNEVLADPTPVVNLPNAEYVELYNSSNNTFDLAGWQFVNSTTAKTLPSFALLPGETVILCDTNFISLFTTSIGITSFSALTNDTDSLTLLDNNGQIIDQLVYSIDWYATSLKASGGWSLELINPHLSCQSASNWSESSNANGGTPNAINSVFNISPDITVPVSNGISVIDPFHVLIQFNETMQTSSLSQTDISVDPFGIVANVEWNSSYDGIIVTLTNELQLGITYTISISGPNDCSGNALASFNQNFVLGYPPLPGDIIFTEIMADPDPSIHAPDKEFVELYNRSDKTIDLNGCTINGGVFDVQTLIYAGQYLVVADVSDAASFFAFPGTVFQETFPALTNSGMTLTLSDPNEAYLDEVSYDDTWYRDNSKKDGGWSLELINPNDPCSDKDNWRACVHPFGSTPGAINSVYDNSPDITPPSLLNVYSQPEQYITLVFNEPIDFASFADILWSVNGSTPVNIPVEFAIGTNNSIIIEVGAIDSLLTYTFSLSGVYDCWGNSVDEMNGHFAFPNTPLPGELILNEIMYYPYSGGYDFVEIYNNGLRPLSLDSCKLSDDPTFGQGNNIIVNDFILYPGEYLVVTENGYTLPSFYPKANKDRIIDGIEGIPTMNSTEGNIYILTPNGSVSDGLAYTSDMQFTLIDDLHGVSLERIDFDRPSEDLTNWHSASQFEGFATPGYINSQIANSGMINATLSISPEVFSPDNDGYQDVTTFSWKIEDNNAVGNISIFDSEGREVRYLMRNELLGKEGSISWDGLANNRQALGIGIYVVYFEIFTTDGQQSKLKKTCVLAHRLD